jgi:glutamine cyclotransferase
LTWQSHVGFVYDKASFELLQQFNYSTEGWGITHDGVHLIMSDGTSTLHFLDPQTFEEISQLAVFDNKGPVAKLNELEYVQGEIYANVWQTDRIARIAPGTGQVVGWIDLEGLLTAEDRTEPVDVLNGIAYDAGTDRLFVTGKLWPKLFEIDLIPPG